MHCFLFAAVASLGAAPSVPVGHLAKELIVVPVPSSPTWQDEAFLAALPVAAERTGQPIVLAVDPSKPWRPEVLDFMERYQPQKIHWIGEAAPPACKVGGDPVEVQHLVCASRTDAVDGLLGLGWTSCERVVLVNPGNVDQTHVAAALAARLGSPLLMAAPGEDPGLTVAALRKLQASSVLCVGGAPEDVQVAVQEGGVSVTHLKDAAQVIAWMVGEGLAVNYLAVSNPATEGSAPHIALAAPALAAGRGGALVPLGQPVIWKEELPTDGGASPGGLRRGDASIDGIDITFHTSSKRGSHRVSFDSVGGGALTWDDETSFATGDEVELGGHRFVVDLDVDMKRRGESLWLTRPAPSVVRSRLDLHRDLCGDTPNYLCIVGWPEAVPPAILAHGQRVDADLVSDAPYAQCDEDPFFEQSWGRIVAEDLPSATLLVARSLGYELFEERDWAKKFATSEWEVGSTELLERAGLDHAGRHEGESLPKQSSPITDAGLVRHSSHASWMQLGKTYAHDGKTLLAPCLFESSGCSPASLDQSGADHPSVAARLLRNGALAFVGNARRGIAQQSLLREELIQHVLAGRSIGDAHRASMNRMLVATLDRGQAKGGPYFYSLYGRALIGDPALVFDVPGRGSVKGAARVDLKGKTATVRAPSRWIRTEYEPLEEWKCRHPKLYTWRGAGVGLEEAWTGDGNFDLEEHIFTCAVTTKLSVNGVAPKGRFEPPLGLVGGHHVDEHGDGTRTVYWRTRLMDVDQSTGKVKSKSKRQRFQLVTK